MEFLKIGEERACVKRGLRARNIMKNMKCNLMEAIALPEGVSLVPHEGEDGMVRVKLVVSKQQLKKMAMMMGSSRSNGIGISTSSTTTTARSSATSLEQVLLALRRRSMKKGNGVPWRPALHSIPEEI